MICLFIASHFSCISKVKLLLFLLQVFSLLRIFITRFFTEVEIFHHWSSHYTLHLVDLHFLCNSILLVKFFFTLKNNYAVLFRSVTFEVYLIISTIVFLSFSANAITCFLLLCFCCHFCSFNVGSSVNFPCCPSYHSYKARLAFILHICILFLSIVQYSDNFLLIHRPFLPM